LVRSIELGECAVSRGTRPNQGIQLTAKTMRPQMPIVTQHRESNIGGMLMVKEIVVVALFAIFLIAAILPRITQIRKKVETVGCIGINRKLFFVGKLSLFTSFILILVQLFFVRLSLFQENDVFFWICVALLGIGVMFFTLAITRLGTFSLRAGLAQENTSLRTTGIYRFSRNPMLFGLYLMALGSAIYVQCPINWILVIIALIVHHKIILVEEVFLQSRFGEQWIRYRNNVRRYM
jgi:protein-S-isoprenylcysteine O-methyltransferase Ste14